MSDDLKGLIQRLRDIAEDPFAVTLSTASYLTAAADALERLSARVEQAEAERDALRELLREAQTAVCVAGEALDTRDLPGRIAEALHRTRAPINAARGGEKQDA